MNASVSCKLCDWIPVACRSVCITAVLVMAVCWAAERSLQAEEQRSAPAADAIPTALQDYVTAEDDSYAWKLQGTVELPEGLGKLHQLELTSQTWQGITWKHLLAVFEPETLEHQDRCLLFITGGKHGSELRDRDLKTGAQLARLSRCRTAFLLQVPNQPLLGDRYEDDLITETFLKYLETRDATWPLLFPMVKSAVRAMDAVSEFNVSRKLPMIDKFVVTGASKRGWTTWLTAVADERVQGIAPMVIDTLNFPKQTKHQINVWGDYSVQIQDYTSKGLVESMEDNPDIPLWKWVDPYTYRNGLSLPKLLINGTNDPYWVLDALNNYWSDLNGRKYILYIPNGDHGLKGGEETALRTIAAFQAHIATGTPLPRLTWKHRQAEDRMVLEVSADTKPQQARLWTAHTESRDFRGSTWTARPMENGTETTFTGSVPRADSGHVALFAELQFVHQGIPYSLCTQVNSDVAVPEQTESTE